MGFIKIVTNLGDLDEFNHTLAEKSSFSTVLNAAMLLLSKEDIKTVTIITDEVEFLKIQKPNGQMPHGVFEISGKLTEKMWNG